MFKKGFVRLCYIKSRQTSNSEISLQDFLSSWVLLQTLFGTGIAVSQTQSTRSRPGSFIEQSQIFIRPPPPSAATNSMTWSNSTAQIEYFAGAIGATPSMTTQPVSSMQRFQVNSVGLFLHNCLSIADCSEVLLKKKIDPNFFSF